MPAHRLPAQVAAVTGAAKRNPKRHAGRRAPANRGLGDPSPFLDQNGQAAWEGFKREMPWLTESHRAIVEVCALVRGELLASEEVGVTRLSMYQSMLSKLGGTPVDETKVAVPDDEERDEFFDD